GAASCEVRRRGWQEARSWGNPGGFLGGIGKLQRYQRWCADAVSVPLMPDRDSRDSPPPVRGPTRGDRVGPRGPLSAPTQCPKRENRRSKIPGLVTSHKMSRGATGLLDAFCVGGSPSSPWFFWTPDGLVSASHAGFP